VTTACYVVCDEEAELARSLRSVKAYVDRFVIVDAAFTSRPGESTHSSDATRAVAMAACAGKPVSYLEARWKMEEQEARNWYLEEVPSGEWMLLIDADEVLYGDHFEVLQFLADLPGVDTGSVGVRVLTTAVLTGLNAPEISADAYATAPVIATSGWMPKLVRQRRTLRHARLEVAPGIWTHHGLIDGTEPVDGSGVRSEALWIVNDHVGQSHERYQLDFTWEYAQRHGG
jgi:hypothetical protein